MIAREVNLFMAREPLLAPMNEALANRGDAPRIYNRELLDVVRMESTNHEVPIATYQGLARVLGGQPADWTDSFEVWEKLERHVDDRHKSIGQQVLNCACPLDARMTIFRIKPLVSTWEVTSDVGFLPETIEATLAEQPE